MQIAGHPPECPMGFTVFVFGGAFRRSDMWCLFLLGISINLQVSCSQVAMGQNPVLPVNIPMPTKID